MKNEQMKNERIPPLRIAQATRQGYVEVYPGMGGGHVPMVTQPMISVHPLSRKLEFKGTESLKPISPALRATDNKCPHVVYEPPAHHVKERGEGPSDTTASDYRIRKLTPRECFRLMDLSDGDIDKIQTAGLSDNAQYGLAGNSIVVNCLYLIFRNMFIPEFMAAPEPPPPKQLSIFDIT